MGAVETALQSTRRSGVRTVDRAFLDRVPLPPAGARTRWAGVQHGELVSLVEDAARRFELELESEQFQVSENLSKMFGYLTFKTDPVSITMLEGRMRDVGLRTLPRFGDFDPQVVGLRLGLIHANDSSYGLRFLADLRVQVCGNGLVVGTKGEQVLVFRKHTKGIMNDLPQLVEKGLGRFLETAQNAGEEIKQLQSLRFPDETSVHDVICIAATRGILPWSSMGKVLELWKEPEFPEFKEPTAWSLLNCFTQVARKLPFRREMKVAAEVKPIIVGRGLLPYTLSNS